MGALLLGLGVFLFGGGFLYRGVSQARQNAWAGPRTTGMRQRASKGGSSGAGASRPVRHEIKLLREKAKLDNWLKHEDHARKNGATAATGGTPASVTRPPTPLQRAYANVRSRSSRNTATGNGTQGTVIPPAAQSRPATPPQAPPQAPPQHVNTSASNGRTATMAASSGNAVEQFVEGVNQIHAQAQSGGLSAKLGGVKASHEGCVRFAAMAAMLARAMSEPGHNYGPEITEPIAKAGTHLQAAAMSFSEADAALSSLGNMRLFDVETSPRQAPHHSELTESGSH